MKHMAKLIYWSDSQITISIPKNVYGNHNITINGFGFCQNPSRQTAFLGHWHTETRAA